MRTWLAIAAYRCEVSGTPTGSVDVKVRQFRAEDADAVGRALRAETAEAYVNHLGEPVRWPLSAVVAIEEAKQVEDGEEVVGFITDAGAFDGWSRPPLK